MEISLNSLYFSRIHYLFYYFPQNQHEFTICFAFHNNYTIFFVKSLTVSRNHYEFAMKSLWIHFLSREFISFSRFHCQFIISFVNTLSFSRIQYLFREFTLNPLYFLQHHYKFESRWIHYPFHFNTVNSLFISRFYYEFAICFAISLWIHYLFREFTLNPLSFSQNHDEFSILFTFSL